MISTYFSCLVVGIYGVLKVASSLQKNAHERIVEGQG